MFQKNICSNSKQLIQHVTFSLSRNCLRHSTHHILYFLLIFVTLQKMLVIYVTKFKYIYIYLIRHQSRSGIFAAHSNYYLLSHLINTIYPLINTIVRYDVADLKCFPSTIVKLHDILTFFQKHIDKKSSSSSKKTMAYSLVRIHFQSFQIFHSS